MGIFSIQPINLGKNDGLFNVIWRLCHSWKEMNFIENHHLYFSSDISLSSCTSYTQSVESFFFRSILSLKKRKPHFIDLQFWLESSNFHLIAVPVYPMLSIQSFLYLSGKFPFSWFSRNRHNQNLYKYLKWSFWQEKVSGWKPLPSFAKGSVLDVWLGSDYTSEYVGQNCTVAHRSNYTEVIIRK